MLRAGKGVLPACLLALVAGIFAACAPAGNPSPIPTQGSSTAQTPPLIFPTAPSLSATPAPAGFPTPEPEGYWVQPGVPRGLVDRVAPALALAGFVPVSDPQDATLQVILNPGPDAVLTAEWVYALAAPFPTVPDELSWGIFSNYWLSGDMAGMAAFGGPPHIVLTPDTLELLTGLIGPMAAGLPATVYDHTLITDFTWSQRPSLSIVPFDQLNPRWKVLTVDGKSLFDRALDTTSYPLAIRAGVVATTDRAGQVAGGLHANGAWTSTNRNPGNMTIVVMTGVTALVRATASMMLAQGIYFPAAGIMPFLSDADILHTSNEVAFTPDCPHPEWEGEPSGFCSGVTNFELLRYIGLDVVELTGNHVNDYGYEALRYTLDLYASNGIITYGGGWDSADAASPRILLLADGTRLAFLGCNLPGPPYAFAGEDTPGAASCGDFSAITGQIRALKESGQAEIVIATVQYWEAESYEPGYQQVADFNLLADAGADIVIGTQAHQPQGFAFEGDAFIHYGIGNLFFDQMQTLGYRQMFADKFILYEGRHLSTVLFTGLMEAYSQPNPMPPADRASFLQMMFELSGW